VLPTVSIFGREVALYGLCIVCGALLAGLTACRLGRRCALDREDIIYCGLYMAVGAIVGGKLAYIGARLPEVSALWQTAASRTELIRALFRGGFLFFGGLFGGLFMGWRYCRRFGVDMHKMACCVIPAAPLLHAWGRLGCFCAGCCYGIPWSGPLAVINTRTPVGVNGVPLFPVQLLSVGLNLLLFAFMLRSPRLRWPAPAGRLAGFYLAVYSLARFGVEFLRGDHPGHVWQGLTWAQWFCLPAMACGLLLLYRSMKKTA